MVACAPLTSGDQGFTAKENERTSRLLRDDTVDGLGIDQYCRFVHEESGSGDWQEQITHVALPKPMTSRNSKTKQNKSKAFISKSTGK